MPGRDDHRRVRARAGGAAGVTTALAVALLSGTGAVARVLTSRALGEPAHRGTLLLNLAGAFALGVLTGAGVTGDGLLLAGTAFLGSFTTFSTWMLDEASLPAAAAGRLLAAATLGGAACAAAGWALAAAV
ncbi:fluoride efflux transporter CrcB [Paraconexibacter algicola]|uniref:Fluoride-specific ion channel n=1 Tax=Paraconexibacter algicola TaxID=2133960 RepID=A0A2T4UNC8_9ACTN|nr:fluoride efflux transporter CrcB [Paraconexibacter algicola]